MSVPFSQTTRSLAGQQNKAWTGLVISIVLLLLWLTWFFFGHIAELVGGQSVSIRAHQQPVWRVDNGRTVPYTRYMVQTRVTTADIERIKPGQRVFITFKGDPTLPLLPLKAKVEQVDIDHQTVHSSIAVAPDEARLDGTVSDITVEIEVASQTPAAYLFHVLHAK